MEDKTNHTLPEAHRIRVFVRAVLFTLIAHGIASAADWPTARSLYYKAVEGDRAAGARAVTLTDELRRSDQDNPLLLAYRGSLLLLESSWAMAPWKKGKLAKEGLAMMDRAVTLAPRDLEVRFVRAASSTRLPGFFHRADQAAADFAELAPLVADAVRSGKLEPRLGTAALHYHSLNLEKAGNRGAAREACSLAMSIAPKTPGAAACGSRLNTD
jgi:hypothetical protein